MPDTIAYGEAKIYPACEMKAVDMAELVKAMVMFSGERRTGSSRIPVNGGVIQGCRLAVPSSGTSTLRVSPGRIIICGRLAEFKPAEGSNYIYLSAPSVATPSICIVVAVCDLSDQEHPFYITVVKNTDSLDAAASLTLDEDFNLDNGLRYLRLATVKVSTSGHFSELTYNHTSYDIASNKTYVDNSIAALKSDNECGNLLLLDWVNYLRKARFRAAFFKTYTAVADGLTLNGGTTKVFKLRKEYKAETTIATESGGITNSRRAYIVLKPNGDIIGEGAGITTPVLTPITSNGVPSDIGSDYSHLSISGVSIENSTSGASGVANLVLKSFYTDENNHVCAEIKNLGSGTARFKLSISSLYARDV